MCNSGKWHSGFLQVWDVSVWVTLEHHKQGPPGSLDGSNGSFFLYTFRQLTNSKLQLGLRLLRHSVPEVYMFEKLWGRLGIRHKWSFWIKKELSPQHQKFLILNQKKIGYNLEFCWLALWKAANSYSSPFFFILFLHFYVKNLVMFYKKEV